jgi:hypothetical protein
MAMDKKLNRAYYLYRTYKLNTTGFREYTQIAESMGLSRGELNACLNRVWNERETARWRQKAAA